AVLARADHLRAQHQLGKIDRELVRRHVRALGEAELALIAELDHALRVSVLQEPDRIFRRDLDVLQKLARLVLLDDSPALDMLAFGFLAVRIERVDAPEEHVERRTEVEAETAPV